MKLTGKKALITGGNSGIGLATARLFVAEGAEVAITGRDQKTLDEAVAELGPNARGYRADVTVADDRKRLFADLAKDFGKLDIVFANAGISGSTPTGATDEAVFENIVHTNLNGAFFTVNSAAPLLNDNASIIFNGSVHNYIGQAGLAAYAATKGGVVSMARAIAADFAPRNIRVNVVAPGATKTPIWKRGSRASMSAEQSAKLADLFSSTVPLGRWGEPEELAKAVLFLASEEFVVHQCGRAGGGRRINRRSLRGAHSSRLTAACVPRILQLEMKMTQAEHFDALVLGSGPGGNLLAWHLAPSGQRVALVERRYIGGSCPNIACMPSKNEVWSARIAYLTRRAAQFGTITGPVTTDMAKVRQRKRDMVEREIADHIAPFKSSGAELVMGSGNFVAPKTLEVQLNDGGMRRLTGDKVIIDVGSHAAIPSIPGLAEARPLTHIEALELDDAPSHLIVLGGGYVGLELAQAYRRFGSRVTVIEAGSQLMSREDPDVADTMQRILREEGVRLLLSAATLDVSGRSGDEVTLAVRTPAGEETLRGKPHPRRGRARPQYRRDRT